MLLRVLALALVCLAGSVAGPVPAAAGEHAVRLHAPAELVETGLLRHALPRFSLKTQTRVELEDDPDAADLVLGDSGQPLFSGLGRTWKLEVRNDDHPGAQKLVSWLTSDVGRRTVQTFAPDGTPLFGAPAEAEREVAVLEMDGDAELGHRVSRSKCIRCHAVDDETRGWGIGSTPSFGILRALPDWEERFSAFYVLNPHPAFTQIADVTPPFPADRPSPIAPIELTLDELEALMAYVAAMPAADLGRPLVHQ